MSPMLDGLLLVVVGVLLGAISKGLSTFADTLLEHEDMGSLKTTRYWYEWVADCGSIVLGVAAILALICGMLSMAIGIARG